MAANKGITLNMRQETNDAGNQPLNSTVSYTLNLRIKWRHSNLLNI